VLAPHMASTSPHIPLDTRVNRRVLAGQALRAVAMPLGGIGAGTIALAGDGGWRQWQIHNRPNHLGYVPHSFFAAWMRPEAVHFTKRRRPEDLMGRARVLQSAALYDDAAFVPPVTTSDHIVPDEARRLLAALPGVDTIEYVGEYPIAQVTYRDPAFPFPVTLEAYSPFAPLDEEFSGLPAIICAVSATNTADMRWEVGLAATLQNAVGWDGVGRISGASFPGYGGNANRALRLGGMTAIHMTNDRLPRESDRWGEMVLAALDDDATVLGRWDTLDAFWADFASDGRLSNGDDGTPSVPGATVNGALARTAWLRPGETLRATFVLAWYFPNRHVDWDQRGFGLDDRKSEFWIGTHYATRFRGALDVAEHVRDHAAELDERTHRFRDAFYDSTLPYWFLDAVTSQASIIRSPTCIWLEDGTFHAFEGCHGASTGSPEDTGGRCPLNCTHVWNYEQALARLFPRLEQRMRRVDLEKQTTDEGRIGHRTLLPLYLPRWTAPAADGQVGTILKLYRDFRASGDRAFLDALWPAAKRAMEFTFHEWDTDGDGIMSGRQPNTYDCSIHGHNSFLGTLYLAALRAAEEMARIEGDRAFAAECRRRFDVGSPKLDAELWDGEYYVQLPEPDKGMDFQYGTGCHSDQLLGQWWAHLLDLGYVLPEEHVKEALASIVRHNWRRDFVGFAQAPRIYASDRDEGLVICTWPKGGRPEKPTLYSDEVWPGVEYQVAGHLLREGMADEAFMLVRSARGRYNGRERNPWNEVECGDHYARSMSSWAMLEAALGFRYDASRAAIGFGPKVTPEYLRAPFVTAAGWGTFSTRIAGDKATATIELVEGTLRIATLELDLPTAPQAVAGVTLAGEPVDSAAKIEGTRVRIAFAAPVELAVGMPLVAEMAA